MRTFGWLLIFGSAGCADFDDRLGPAACVTSFEEQAVCFDAPDRCDGEALDVGCTAAGYSVAVEDCEDLIAGTEGGFVEPGLCPAMRSH